MMKKSIEIIKDRKKSNPNFKIKMGEIIESHFLDLRHPPSLAGLKLFEILFKTSGEKIAEDNWHEIKLIDLKETVGFKNYDKENLRLLLQELRSTTISFQQENETFITGLIDIAIIKSDPESGLIKIKWKFSEPFRNMAFRSRYWAILDHQISLSMNSRYALRLYEILSLRIGLTHKNKEFFSIQEIRNRLGVKEGKLERWTHLYNRAILPAIIEINEKARFNIKINPRKCGRSIIGIEFHWETKKIKMINNPSLPQKQKITFPKDGSISFSQWGDIARNNLPSPLPDVDIVAQNFRNWLIAKAIPYNSSKITDYFKGFCLKYKKIL